MNQRHTERLRGAHLLVAGAAVAAITGACSSTPGSADPDSGAVAPDGRPTDAAPVDAVAGPSLRYHEVQQKSSHNSYQRDEALLDQMIYHRVRSIELDIHHSKGAADVPGDWFVYHTRVVDEGTSCVHLSDCLRELAAFQRAVPAHEVVTVWIDLKDPFNAGHQPADLDALLAAALPAGALFSPADLMDACAGADSLQGAVTGACSWPDVRDLRGRVIAVLTGGSVADSQPLAEYLFAGNGPRGRAAFVAPDAQSAAQLAEQPDVVFFNMALGDRDLAADVHDAGFIGRVWGVNTMADFDASLAARAHHVATDKVNYLQDTWSTTHDSLGWPFRCIDPGCPALGPEPGALMTMRVDSGDIWDSQDSLFLAYQSPPAGAHSWTGFVSTVNSHVEEWGKGCLMARAGLSADAAYFAVCRPADRHRLRVQLRPDAGASSQAVEADIVPGGTIAPESVVFVRLDIDADARCASGYGSQDGVAWQLIAQQCFAAPLLVEGIAAASHDGGLVSFVFGDITRTSATSEEHFDEARFSDAVAIGANAAGALSDGI